MANQTTPKRASALERISLSINKESPRFGGAPKPDLFPEASAARPIAEEPQSACPQLFLFNQRAIMEGSPMPLCLHQLPSRTSSHTSTQKQKHQTGNTRQQLLTKVKGPPILSNTANALKEAGLYRQREQSETAYSQDFPSEIALCIGRSTLTHANAANQEKGKQNHKEK